MFNDVLLLLSCVGRQQNDLITYNNNLLLDSYYFRLELLSCLSVAVTVVTLRCLFYRRSIFCLFLVDAFHVVTL